MENIKTFKSYNFVTGAVDGTLAYDFSAPGFYSDELDEEEEKAAGRPRRRERQRAQEWIKEDARPTARERSEAKSGQGLSVVSLIGAAVAVVLVTMMLLAQIRLTDISDTAADLEAQITALETERDKLTVTYETVFNLKDVEEHATNVLGMQEPDNEQVFYLTGVASADKAVVVTKEDADLFSMGLSDILSSVKAYFS